MTNICKPVEIGHFVIRTREVAPLVTYYKIFFGAKVACETYPITFLSYDNEHHRIAIILDPSAVPKPTGRPPPPTCGFDHIAFTVPSLGQLLRSYRLRKDAGLTPAYCLDHGLTLSMYYVDPDGNKVELQADSFEDKADAVRFMGTKVFADNPRGVEYNPDELLERLEAGESEASLLARMLGRKTIANLRS
ncbi:hypothetical protein MCOR25_003293 [Pyricularia grisea]|nr:hypothetical protein MCOR25_003293 [Pyricularia grisea]